jgi:thiol-disulfide isomerase/thioredoxin
MPLFAALLLATSSIAVRPAADAARLPAEIGQGKPVLLHFWATWCDACRDEFPKLKKLLNGLPSRGVAVGLVSIGAPASASSAQEFLVRYGVGDLPSFLLDAPKPDPVTKAIGDRKWDGALPATFLFDARGKRVKSFIGAQSPAKIERAVRRLGR